jgi:DNA-binding beta-propeller fold protein YncE
MSSIELLLSRENLMRTMLGLKRFASKACFVVLALGTLAACSTVKQRVEGVAAGSAGPRYAVDATWPKPLPNHWILGQVAGIATAKDDTIWMIHRPLTLTDDEKGSTLNPKRSKCCSAAPAVMQFDRDGNLLRSWGGKGQGYDWPANEHGIYVDPKGDVWIGGNAATDHMLLKFTAEGKFLLQIGKPGASRGSNDPEQLGRPAHMEVDPAANELYVADGYGNRRVIVFDASTGAYKRHWGAYGKRPDDTKIPDYNPESPQFGMPVHCVRMTKDNLLYVCDRMNNRVQVFKKNGEFVRQFVYDPDTKGSGSVWDLVPSEDPSQRYLLIADGTNNEVRIVLRESGAVIGSFGRPGRQAGDFHWVHNIAIDSQGSVYTSEVDTGKRAQRFVRAQ